MDKTVGWIAAGALVVIAVAVGAMAQQGMRAGAQPALSTEFHAVLLINGQAFFGKVENLEPEHVVLRDVFYIQSRQNPETKQVSNVLIKRGQEWHAPDRMIVNKRQILLIEPVTEGSQVAKLIGEQQAKGAVPAKK
jgi:hypothetical protein